MGRGRGNRLHSALGGSGVSCKASSLYAALPGKFCEMFDCLSPFIDCLSRGWEEPTDSAVEGAER